MRDPVALQGKAWGGVFVGHDVGNPFATEADKKRLLLERFQAEVRRKSAVIVPTRCRAAQSHIVAHKRSSDSAGLQHHLARCFPSAQHPGFDFSGADVTGQVPDASKFMGGIGTQ